jgi:broad-specificity NMP kinase
MLGLVRAAFESVTRRGAAPRASRDCTALRWRVVAVVLVTGMSGTGKSAALAELARRGHRVVDTDYGGYSEEVPSSDAGGSEQLWREDRIDALLDEDDDGALFISGCVSNQGTFYPRFDAVVLLSAPADVIFERMASRETNEFGKSDAERDRILDDLAKVEPLLRTGATAEIDTRVPLDEVVDALERIADTVARR